MEKVIFYMNGDNFIYFIQIYGFFASCPIALARTSFEISNRSSGSGHSCLIPSLRGKH